MKINVGCGNNIIKGYINIDYKEHTGVDLINNLEEAKLPFNNDSIEEIYGSHVLEHIKNILPLMEEFHRIIKPNGIAIFRVPYGSSDDAYEDPTHVRNYFINSWGFYSQPFFWKADYGYKGDWVTEEIILVMNSKLSNLSKEELWSLINHQRNVVKEMVAILKPVKPIRQPNKELQIFPIIHYKFEQ